MEVSQMSKKLVVATLAALFAASLAGPVAADIVDPDSSYCTVTYNRTFPTGSQFVGDPYDYITIAPDAAGETFFNVNGVNEPDGLADIDIRVYLRNGLGDPLIGVPAQEVVVFNSQMCICPGGNISDAGTDSNGMAQFTGTIAAGGCVTSLDVYADGVYICTLNAGGRNVKTNSPDYAHQGTSPCFADASDLGFIATQLGQSATGRICSDFNELGSTIDASDLAFFASFLGAACQ
jgi:hypothetical protein